ncbi:MAG: hypothetical protein R3324_14520 [Halobacteriales archaeon]|nr:hypothetical protein [Halobacteriales archaeon]
MTPSRDGGERTGTQEASVQDGQQQSNQDQGANQQSEGTEPAGLLANAAIRFGLLATGFVLFLFALGQAVGFGLLDLFVEAITSQTGRWLVVAFFGLVLIGLARTGIQGTLFDS